MMAEGLIYPTSLETVKYSTPKRVRLSLKHQLEHSPAEAVDPCCSQLQDDMLIDDNGDQDENLSPNCSVLVKKKDKVSLLGLPNCGNTCYLNSILQVLRFTPNFLKCLHLLVTSQMWLAQVSSDDSDAKTADFFSKLHMLYTTMKKQEEDFVKDDSAVLLDSLQSFVKSLGEISALFEEGEQHDAHELLLTIMSQFNTSSAAVLCQLKTVIDRSNSSAAQASSSIVTHSSQHKTKRKPVKCVKRQAKLLHKKDEEYKVPTFDLGFEGKMQHILKCLECEKRWERIEAFTNLEVSVAEDSVKETVDLCQCLVQRAFLSGENKFFCEECYHLTEAQLSSEVTSLPAILMLHCSGLKKSCFFEVEKHSAKIQIPLILKTSENPNIFQPPTDETYSLYAVVLHIGLTTEEGHYVSFVKVASQRNHTQFDHLRDMEYCCASDKIINMRLNSLNNWLLFDDEKVTEVYVNDSYIFPYYKFVAEFASPCIILYYKE